MNANPIAIMDFSVLHHVIVCACCPTLWYIQGTFHSSCYAGFCSKDLGKKDSCK